MKQVIFLVSIGLAILFSSCEKVGKVCNVSDPFTELPWLAEKKREKKADVFKAIFKDKKTKKRIEGFIIEQDETFYDDMTIYFNCSGEPLCYIGGVLGFRCSDYDIIKKEVIYKAVKQ